MQGKKELTPKMLYQVHLTDLIPEHNFYRMLDSAIDFRFLYKSTNNYYGDEGQESIDPVFFFKICLVGYLNNINSDRKLIEYCSNCLDVRLFIRYDIDELLPWHSTISRTRQLYGEDVFMELFKKILSLCVEKGMVRGKRQAVDSAFIKANASMDSLIEKEVLTDAQYYADELNDNSEFKARTESSRSVSQTRSKQVAQHHNWKREEYKTMPKSSTKGDKMDENGNLIRPKYVSNHTHYSPTDTDARVSVKPGKARQLNYFGQLAVDDAHHVITGACADFADKRDAQCLAQIVELTKENLEENQIALQEVLADAGYSSGAALAYLNKNTIDAWIPNFGQYKPEREGFIYNKEKNHYECVKEGGHKAILVFKGEKIDSKGYKKHQYRSSESHCKDCPLREACCGKATKYKKLDDSIHKELYDKMHQKLTKNSEYAKRMVKVRSKTVEPVLGTLINFTNMKRVNTRGIKQANKHVLMAALTYNLKKYMKFIVKKPYIKAQVMHVEKGKTHLFLKTYFLELKRSFLSFLVFEKIHAIQKINLA
jgi:transposase